MKYILERLHPRRITRTGWMLIAIVSLSLFLRLYNLSSVPSGFHQDEVVNTYIGRYILQNGVDVYGNAWPFLYFNKHGDYPPVVPMYVTGLGTYLFGNTVLGSRIIIALIGALTVIPVFGIARRLLNNTTYAGITAFLLAIMPWHLSFSRISAEGILATTVYITALWIFLIALEKQKNIVFALAFFLLFSTYLLYPGYRIIVPLTVLPLLLLPWIPASKTHIRFRSRTYAICVALVIAAFALTLSISATEWGRGRFDQTSLLRSLEAEDANIQGFIANEDSILVARIFNNKVINFVRIFFHQFLSYFSPIFLFFDGGAPPWFDIPNSGLLYLTYLVMLVPCVIPFIKKDLKGINMPLLHFLLYLIPVAILPAALTTEHTPNTHRSILLSVVLAFLIGTVLYSFRNWKIKKLPVIAGFFMLLAVEGIYFFHMYFQHVGMYTEIHRSDGNRQAVEYIKANKDSYDEVYMLATGWFPIYYAYFTDNYSPQLAGKIRIGLRTDTIDNVTFLEQDCSEDKSLAYMENNKKEGYKALFLNNIGCPKVTRTGVKEIGNVTTASGFPIYTVYEYSR